MELALGSAAPQYSSPPLPALSLPCVRGKLAVSLLQELPVLSLHPGKRRLYRLFQRLRQSRRKRTVDSASHGVTASTCSVAYLCFRDPKETALRSSHPLFRRKYRADALRNAHGSF